MPPEVERKYQLTRVKTSDYLLPGNSGRTLYRLTRGTTGEGWDVWKFLDPFRGALDPDDLTWDHWKCVAQKLETRRDAIRESLRLG